MYQLNRTFRSVFIVLCAFELVALSGCDDREKSTEPTQVAARVNSQDISVHQVETVLQSQPGLAARLGNKAVERVLNSLIEQELAAQAAKSADLDHSPKVLQAIELAKREVLARAYQDKLAGSAVEPSSNEIDRYYETRPELFAQRRRYNLQDTVVEVGDDQRTELQTRVQRMNKPEDVEPALRSMGLRYSTRAQLRFAEELPSDLLTKITPQTTGHSVLIEREGGVEIFTLVSSEPAPLGLNMARPTIKAFFLQDRRKQLVQDGMKALRASARIEYVAKPMPAPDEPASSAAPASAHTSASGG